MKHYRYTVRRGAQVLATWGPGGTVAVLSDPSFSMEVDGGLSPLSIDLAPEDIDTIPGLSYGNVVETTCIDDDAPDGVLVHAGTIERISRTYAADKTTVTVSVEPFVTQLAHDYFSDDAATTLAKTWEATDVATILAYLVTKSNVGAGAFARLYTTPSSVQASGALVSIQVGFERFLDAITRIKKLGPGNYYWFVAADGTFFYRSYDSGTRHVLTLGREISELNDDGDLADMKNVVLFWNQSDTDVGAIALIETDNTSVAAYGRRAEVNTDSRIDDADAARAAARAFLTEHKDPVQTFTCTVADGTDNTTGSDIERLQPGDTVELRNVPSAIPAVLSVLRVDYAPDAATLTLGLGPVRRPRTLGMTIEEMATFIRTSTNGSIPSTTTA